MVESPPLSWARHEFIQRAAMLDWGIVVAVGVRDESLYLAVYRVLKRSNLLFIGEIL